MGDIDEQSELESFIEAHTRLVTGIYDSAKSYSNLIIGAGYAGFFALLSATKAQLSKREILLAALSMVISLGSFVLFEVAKTFVVGNIVRKRSRVLFDGSTISKQQFIEKVKSVERTGEKAELRLAGLWMVSWTIAAVFGLLAAGILMVSYIRALTNA